MKPAIVSVDECGSLRDGCLSSMKRLVFSIVGWVDFIA